MTKRGSSCSQRPAGQAMAEFAGVATLSFLLLFAIIEMGIAVYRYSTVSMAAREAARYAMVHSPTSVSPATNDQIQAVAIKYAPFLSVGNVPPPFFITDPTLPKQEDAQVTITYNYTQHIPFMSAFPLTLTSSSQMLVSQ
jgi:Flp pilus assembly protein TadG